MEREVFPELVGERGCSRYREGGWRDIGTPASYLAANMEWMPAGGLVDPTAVVEAGADVDRIGGRCRGSRDRRAARASSAASCCPGRGVEAGAVVPRSGRGQGREGWGW